MENATITLKSSRSYTLRQPWNGVELRLLKGKAHQTSDSDLIQYCLGKPQFFNVRKTEGPAKPAKAAAAVTPTRRKVTPRKKATGKTKVAVEPEDV